MNIRNPLTIDSLDKPNAPTGVQTTKTTSLNAVHLFGLVIGAFVLLLLFFVGKHELWELTQQSYGTQRTFLEWLYNAVVFLMVALPFGVIGVTIYYWYNVARTKAYISGMDAPVHVQTMKEQAMAMQALAIAMERMNKSIYSNVATLTLDQSTSNTSNATTTSLEGLVNDTNDIVADEVVLDAFISGK